ncbi:nuclear transcription factor Y subunit B-4-like [Solanum lycopersicum]|uniref:nuclear transcription factor Y subunit B-4-like n=1 Tax=Solanum lycopersicum TaxID=4081 RepID=UPI000532EFC3|nr:nuclear transcription factor Y subunit B-6-like [Solanum lycopersicum]
MTNGNHVGSGNGGFHSYRRSPQPTPARSPSSDMERSMGMPAHLNQAITECITREQDQFMPIANVVRIMRRILPSHAKISDGSKQTIQECVSEFISFTTLEANDRCQSEQRKTVTPEDILWAMSKVGFDDYIEPLTLYLNQYREFDGGESESLRGETLLVKQQMAHDHGYFVSPPPMDNNDMQGDASNGSTSQCAVASVDSDIESPAEEGKE